VVAHCSHRSGIIVVNKKINHMAVELTIKQACEHPASFMYIWASDQFLNAINAKYASVIRTKRANQKKVLMLSAEKYLGDYTKVNQYYDAIASAFKEAYDVTPSDALLILAQGGEVAGKNWSEGVYGVGALPTSTFSGITTGDGSTVSVDAATGHIFYGNKDITDESKTVYNNVKGKVIAYQLFGKDDFGYVYMSQYNKTRKKYHAQSYSTAQGQYCARTGNEINASDTADIWGTILSSLEIVVQWILSIFGGVSVNNRETISAENTLPNQQEDGFVQEAGFGGATTTLLLLVAGGALLAGGINPKTKK
jgi:hypothetical protein